MRQFMALAWFHLKLYVQNSYFLTLMGTSTLSMFFLQYLVASGTQQWDSALWLRAGIVGLWSCGTTAAGIIGMQRGIGTLTYLINNRVSDYLSLAAVVAPASIFGVLSFGVALGVALLLGIPLQLNASLLLMILALWMVAFALDLLIAGLFVLTPHAIIYEQLVTFPILICSGLYPLPEAFNVGEPLMDILFPIAIPIKWLLGQYNVTYYSAFAFLGSLVLCGGLSLIVTRWIIQHAKQTGRLGVKY
ncbi:MAG: multidrug ABC transporter permease [Aerococcus sp.]|nr:multidrug ABC transporter permease [Aerococcus sp.]